VKTINVTDKTGTLIGLLNVNEKQDLMITCKSGVTIRTSIASIREAGRATQGVKLIKLDEGDEIAAITNLDDSDEIDEEMIEGEAGNIETIENSATELLNDASIESEDTDGDAAKSEDEPNNDNEPDNQ
jgi:DNA gyrase subunit A